ncbi:MAG TPA: AMP-binding protein, partial [Pilimelia sp.]|nr:AMP-binding protein [Pilimelia sp.]
MTANADARLRAVFSAAVARTPDALAVACGDRFVTYGELADLTDRLARRLRQHGVRRGDVVAVHFTRSELPVIAILACHSLAATYVPIDPDCPPERMRAIVEELGVAWCVTERALGEGFAPLLAPRRTIAISHDSAFFTVGVRTRDRQPVNEAEPDDAAYVTYTRDPHGRPRAVVVAHRHVAAYLAAFARTCPTGVGDRVYQGHSLSFDGSVAEIWAALASGATLVIPEPDAPRSGAGLAALLAAEGVTHLATTPTALGSLDPAALPGLRAVVLSGGPCPQELVDRWAAGGTTLLNVYGPAETTIHALVKRCEPGRPVTLGRALPGYEVTVVGPALRPVEDGHTGELLLGGPALTAGYVGDPELTRERFVTLESGRRAFRTGDRVRRRSDGELEYRGRAVPEPAPPAVPRQRASAAEAAPVADRAPAAAPPPAAPPPAAPAAAAEPPARAAAAPAARRPSPDGTPRLAGPPVATPPLYPPPPRTARDEFRDTADDVRRHARRRQLLGLYLVAATVAVPAALAVVAIGDWVTGADGVLGLLRRLTLLGLLTWPTLLTVALAAKWVLIGRYAPGEHPLWGDFHRRWWLVDRLFAVSGVGLLAGTPLLPWYLRLLGAKIGPGVHLDTVRFGAFDLLTIGAGSAVGIDADLRGWTISRGVLRIGAVTVGARVCVGARAVLGRDVVVGDDCALDDQTHLPDRTRLPAGQRRAGAPAVAADVPVPARGAPATAARRVAFGAAHLLGAYLLQVVFALPLLAAAVLLRALAPALGAWSAAGATVAALPLLLVGALALLAGARRQLAGQFYEDSYPVHSGAYLRKWLSEQVMRGVAVAFAPLYGTLFAPWALRLFGARVAARAEVERVRHLPPETVEVGAGARLAVDAVLGPRRTFGGTFTARPHHVGRHAEVGERALLPAGTSLGDDSGLEPGAVPPHGVRTPAGSRWSGAPARRRHDGPPGLDPYEPGRRELAERAVLDGLGVLVPYVVVAGGLVAFAYPLYRLHALLGTWAVLPAAPLAALAAGALATLAAAAVKWLVLGEVRPRAVHCWAPYVRLYALVHSLYATVAAPLLAPLTGTPYLAGALRWFGVRVGAHAYLGTTAIAGFDLVEVGDYAAVDAEVLLRADRPVDGRCLYARVRVGPESAVGRAAVLVSGAELGARATLDAMSVVPAGVAVPEGARGHG